MKNDCKFFMTFSKTKKKKCKCKRNNMMEVVHINCKKYNKVTEKFCDICKRYCKK